jgi:hypothetical protein
MTPDLFLERVLGAADELALALSHTPHDRQKAWLEGFADRTRKQWRSLFMPALSAQDVDGMVTDVLSRVSAKRDFLERHGAGSA